MNDWQKDLWEEVEKTSVSLEKFFLDVNQAIESFANDVGEAIEELGEQLQDTVVTEVDRLVEDLIDFVAETNSEIDRNLWDDLDDLFNNADFVEMSFERPTQERNPACVGCCHYHGQAYNGELLVCGMHPSGVEGNQCHDWEGI